MSISSLRNTSIQSLNPDLLRNASTCASTNSSSVLRGGAGRASGNASSAVGWTSGDARDSGLRCPRGTSVPNRSGHSDESERGRSAWCSLENPSDRRRASVSVSSSSSSSSLSMIKPGRDEDDSDPTRPSLDVRSTLTRRPMYIHPSSAYRAARAPQASLKRMIAQRCLSRICSTVPYAPNVSCRSAMMVSSGRCSGIGVTQTSRSSHDLSLPSRARLPASSTVDRRSCPNRYVPCSSSMAACADSPRSNATNANRLCTTTRAIVPNRPNTDRMSRSNFAQPTRSGIGATNRRRGPPGRADRRGRPTRDAAAVRADITSSEFVDSTGSQTYWGGVSRKLYHQASLLSFRRHMLHCDVLRSARAVGEPGISWQCMEGSRCQSVVVRAPRLFMSQT